MRYLVVIEKGERNYSSYVPDLPVCVSVGKTLKELRDQTAKAIVFHIECLLEDEDTVPVPKSDLSYKSPPGTTVEFIEVDIDESVRNPNLLNKFRLGTLLNYFSRKKRI
jgi:predicted RNase H-like HicB family nuclease